MFGRINFYLTLPPETPKRWPEKTFIFLATFFFQKPYEVISVNSVRCYQIAFRGLGNHAVSLPGPFRALEIHTESLADTFSSPRKPPGTPHRDLFEPSETMRNASPIPFRPLGNRAERLAASNPSPRTNKKRSCPRGQLLPWLFTNLS